MGSFPSDGWPGQRQCKWWEEPPSRNALEVEPTGSPEDLNVGYDREESLRQGRGLATKGWGAVPHSTHGGLRCAGRGRKSQRWDILGC